VQLLERNPELGAVLNDPHLLQQSMQIASNPSLMREQMRTSDRALSNIEAMPEGFNALRRMFENVQVCVQLDMRQDDMFCGAF
jgi:ubiquilin